MKNLHIIELLWSEALYMQSIGKYAEAEKKLTMLIEEKPENFEFYSERSLSYRLMNNFIKAINDINMAIALNPGYAKLYWMKSALLTHYISSKNTLPDNLVKKLMQLAFKNLKHSQSLNPSSETTWVDIIEQSVINNRYFEALGYYGESKPYVTSGAWQLVRDYLGALAHCFLRKEFNFDCTCKISGMLWCTAEIENFLFQKINKEAYTDTIVKAIKIHQKFLSQINNLKLFHSPYHELMKTKEFKDNIY